MQNYTLSLIYGVELPVATVLSAVFFIPAVRDWTGCNPWIIVAGLLLHLVFHAIAIPAGLHRSRPTLMEFLTNAMDMVATLSIPLATRETGVSYWILYLFVTMIAAYSNPGTLSSFFLILLLPWVDVLWHWNDPEIWVHKVEFAAIVSILCAVIYPVTSMFAQMIRRSHRKRVKETEATATREERARIGQNLHGTLGAALSEISLWHEVAIAGGTSENASTTPLTRAQARAKSALTELRALVADMEGDPLAPAAFYASILGQTQGLCDAAGVRLEFLEPTTPPDGKALVTLDVSTGYHITKVVVEAVTNAVRHARPGTVRVLLSLAPLSIEVVDDGIGFNPENTARGRGLRSLQEHAEALGTGLKIDSTQGGGTRIRLRVDPHESVT